MSKIGERMIRILFVSVIATFNFGRNDDNIDVYKLHKYWLIRPVEWDADPDWFLTINWKEELTIPNTPAFRQTILGVYTKDSVKDSEEESVRIGNGHSKLAKIIIRLKDSGKVINGRKVFEIINEDNKKAKVKTYGKHLSLLQPIQWIEEFQEANQTLFDVLEMNRFTDLTFVNTYEMSAKWGSREQIAGTRPPSGLKQGVPYTIQFIDEVYIARVGLNQDGQPAVLYYSPGDNRAILSSDMWLFDDVKQTIVNYANNLIELVNDGIFIVRPITPGNDSYFEIVNTNYNGEDRFREGMATHINKSYILDTGFRRILTHNLARLNAAFSYSDWGLEHELFGSTLITWTIESAQPFL